MFHFNEPFYFMRDLLSSQKCFHCCCTQISQFSSSVAEKMKWTRVNTEVGWWSWIRGWEEGSLETNIHKQHIRTHGFVIKQYDTMQEEGHTPRITLHQHHRIVPSVPQVILYIKTYKDLKEGGGGREGGGCSGLKRKCTMAKHTKGRRIRCGCNFCHR